MTTSLCFAAPDYHADASIRSARYRLEGSRESGWRLWRDGVECLRVGPGYRALATDRCGICSTDLDRHRLPFPLPQVTGHEVVVRDEAGARYVVEINASHRARGVAGDCPFCRLGFSPHCPDRRTLGIHDLPGGFGPWILAPVEAVIPVPEAVPTATAVLVEPFAAAHNAVATVDPGPGERVAVLGPRRLGLLVIAALAGFRRERGRDFEIIALSRHRSLLALARRLGATGEGLVEGAGENLEPETADVVIDTTGTPAGLELGLRLARRELHVKSTHGRPAGGLRHLTRMVVDEIAFARMPREAAAGGEGTAEWGLPAGRRPRVAWLAGGAPPGWLTGAAAVFEGATAREVAGRVAAAAGPEELPGADVAVVDSLAGADRALRPIAGVERSLVRPRGRILLRPGREPDPAGAALYRAIAGRGLRLSTSRCGDLRQALAMIARDPGLAGLGETLVTHRFGPEDLATAFAVARSPGCVKAVVIHPERASPG